MIRLLRRSFSKGKKEMHATSTSNIFIVIIVSVILSALVNDNDSNTMPASLIKKVASNTHIAQEKFRQCRNSLASNAICVKLIDDLNQGVISNDEFLIHINQPGVDVKRVSARLM